MRSRPFFTSLAVVGLLTIGSAPVFADAASPAQSMTHLKTAAGISSLLESAGVILYAQGGATAGVMGDSISNQKGQVVFHIPVTANRSGVQHVGSNIVLFNTTNDRQVQLRNPVIDLKEGVVKALIPQANNETVTILQISNLKDLKARVTTDRASGIRSRTFASASLSFAPGVSEVITTLLGLPSGSLPDGALFATADVTLKKRVR